MKTISHYGIAFTLVIAVFFSLLVMNLVSFVMLLNLEKNREEEKLPESYFFAGYEVSR